MGGEILEGNKEVEGVFIVGGVHCWSVTAGFPFYLTCIILMQNFCNKNFNSGAYMAHINVWETIESLCVPLCKDWVVFKTTDKLLKPCSLERNNMFPQYVPASPSPHIACWQNGSHFVSSETRLR